MAQDASGNEIGGAKLTPETTKPPEIRDTREQVINAFNSSFSLLEQTPNTELSQDEIDAKEAITKAREDTLQNGRDTFTNTFKSIQTEEIFTQEEGIPIDGLLLFLSRKIESIPEDSPQKQEIINQAHILYRNSEPYYSLPHRMEPERFESRIYQAWESVSKGRRSQADIKTDMGKATENINRRIELRIPKGAPIDASADYEIRVQTPDATQNPAEPESTTEPIQTEETSTPIADVHEEIPDEDFSNEAVFGALPEERTDNEITTTVEEIAEGELDNNPEYTEATEPEPKAETVEQILREVNIVNRHEDIEKRAREIAENQLREEMRRGSALNPLNWARKFRLRSLEEFYRQRYIERARQAMRDSSNSYLEMDVVRNAAIDANINAQAEREAGQATIQRLRSGDLRGEGEQREGFQRAGSELNTLMVNEIIRPALEGENTTIEQIQDYIADFIEEHQENPQIQEMFGRETTMTGQLADYFATDLLEAVNGMRQDIASHKYALENIDSIVKINLGNAHWAADTEARFTAVDRAIRWTQSHRATAWINPATTSAAFSLGIFGAMTAARAGAKATAFVPGLGVLPGAAFAAFRRNYDLKVDMASHKTEMAYNAGIPEARGRREALQRYTYETASIEQLLNGGGEEGITGGDRESLDALLNRDLSDVNTRAGILRRIAEIQERLDFSAEQNVDLITFESRTQVEQGRLALTQAVARAGIAVRNSGLTDAQARESITNFRGQWEARFTENREQQDRRFAGYRVRQSLAAGAIGGAAGLGIGFVGKEILDHTGAGEFIREHVSSLLGHEAPTPSTEHITDTSLGHETHIPPGTHWINNPSDSAGRDLVDAQGHTLISDARFDAVSNTMSYDQTHSTIPTNLIHETPVEHAGTVVQDRPVFGDNGLWDKNTTNIDHTQWYANNTQQSDINELKFYTVQHGDTVTLDASTMHGGFQSGLNPEKVDVQDVIKNHDLSWKFDIPGHGSIVVSDGADGTFDGKLALDPNDVVHHINPADPNSMTVSEFSKIVMNQNALTNGTGGNATEFNNRLDVWNLGADGKNGFISAGKISDQGGQKVWQSFATIRGTGQTPNLIPGVIQKAATTYIQEISMPAISTGEVPLIPVPFAPRFPLEPLVAAEHGGGIYYSYFEPLTEERRALFELNRSKTLKENPKAKLDPYQETQDYFEKQNQDYLEEIKNFSSSMGEMNPEVKTVIGIPVAGHEEENSIYDTLVNYTYQNADKKAYEILLFINHPEGTKQDKTMDEINRFKADYPDMPIKTMYKEIPRADAKMAVIRKYLNDVALYRHYQRGAKAGDIILVSNDADTKGIAPSYIENFSKKLNNSNIDGLIGQLDWDPESYVEYPAIHAGTRLFQYLNLIIWNGSHGDRASSGASFAFKGSIYAGVGGYQINDMPGAEDVILGQAIRDARKNSSTLGYGGARVSRLYTSSRRAIDAWNKGFAPIEQWDRNWGTINESIRRHSLGEHTTVNYDDPAQLEQLRKDLELVLGRTLEYYKDTDGNLENPTFKKAVGWLGIEYNSTPDRKIKITDMSGFVSGIKRYQTYGKILQQVKSGKLPKSALKDMEDELIPTENAPLISNELNASPITTEEIGRADIITTTAPVEVRNKLENLQETLPQEVPAPELRFPARPVEIATEEIENAQVITTTPSNTTPLPNLIPNPTEEIMATAATEAPAEQPRNKTPFEKINEGLSSANTEFPTQTLELDELDELLTNIKLPQGAQLRGLKHSILPDGSLKLDGSISATGGTSRFSAAIDTDRGEINVLSLDVAPAFLHRPFVGRIKGEMANASNLLRNQINQSLIPGWKTQGFFMRDGKFNIGFEKIK